jgi:hypothetical protein
MLSNFILTRRRGFSVVLIPKAAVIIGDLAVFCAVIELSSYRGVPTTTSAQNIRTLAG